MQRMMKTSRPFICQRKLANNVQRLLPPSNDHGMAAFQYLKSDSEIVRRQAYDQIYKTEGLIDHHA